MKRETRDIAMGPADPLPAALPVNLAADGTRGILDDRNTPATANLDDPPEIARLQRDLLNRLDRIHQRQRPNQPNLDARIASYIEYTNTAYAKSGVNIRLRLVHKQLLDWVPSPGGIRPRLTRRRSCRMWKSGRRSWR